MRTPFFSALRGELLECVEGEILEIGFGTGLNLDHYPERVRRITAVDPSEGMNHLARRRIAESGREVDLQVVSAERLPFEAARFDCVISTWTLCSLEDRARALAEVRRVLRPGGRFLFLEHGLHDQPKIQWWQRRLTPLHRRLAVGCRLDVDMEALVRSAEFHEARVERFQLERVPQVVGAMYRGVAIR